MGLAWIREIHFRLLDTRVSLIYILVINILFMKKYSHDARFVNVSFLTHLHTKKKNYFLLERSAEIYLCRYILKAQEKMVFYVFIFWKTVFGVHSYLETSNPKYQVIIYYIVWVFDGNSKVGLDFLIVSIRFVLYSIIIPMVSIGIYHLVISMAMNDIVFITL